MKDLNKECEEIARDVINQQYDDAGGLQDDVYAVCKSYGIGYGEVLSRVEHQVLLLGQMTTA